MSKEVCKLVLKDKGYCFCRDQVMNCLLWLCQSYIALGKAPTETYWNTYLSNHNNNNNDNNDRTLLFMRSKGKTKRKSE